MPSLKKERFIEEFSEEVKKGKASLFIGSGISRKSGYAGWKDILKNAAEEIGLDVEKEKDLITLAHYYVIEKQKTSITHTIKNFFADKKGEPQQIHRIIASLPLNEIWTTNYDTLIERSYKDINVPTTIITNDASYRDVDPDAKIKIYKIHGTIDKASDCVITRDDYDKFESTHDIVLSQLKASMCSKSFLFLGYSFSDTDIQHILFKIRLTYDKGHPQKHYCIIKKVSKNDYQTAEEYDYAVKKQVYYIKDMQQYGINIILIDEFDEIDGILVDIRNKIYSKNVLISGAYENDDEGESISNFTQSLVKELIKNEYKIYTGYGKNLGADIVSGAFDGCTLKGIKFEENVFLYPFPYKTKKTKKVQEMYWNIRKNMCDLTRIHIIISGNKLNNGKICISEGVLNEYELSKEQQHLIIPVAFTGGAALEIWNHEKVKINNDLRDKLDIKSNLDELINIIINYINERSSNGA